MNTLKGKQSGTSVTGWIFYIAVGLFFLLLGFTLIPSYIQFQSVSGIMDDMATQGLGKATPKQIKDAFARGLNINSVYDFDYDTLKITRIKNGGMQMDLEYEDRKPMVGNIDVILSFQKTTEL